MSTGERAVRAVMHRGLPIAVGVLVAIADLTSKTLARRMGEPVPLVPGVTIQSVENARGVFGVLPLSLTFVVSGVVLAALLWWARRAVFVHERVGVSLILGGGITNFLERVITGHVTDILVLGQRSTWNVADAAILLGIGLLLWSWRAGWRAHPRNEKTPVSSER